MVYFKKICLLFLILLLIFSVNTFSYGAYEFPGTTKISTKIGSSYTNFRYIVIDDLFSRNDEQWYDVAFSTSGNINAGAFVFNTAFLEKGCLYNFWFEPFDGSVDLYSDIAIANFDETDLSVLSSGRFSAFYSKKNCNLNGQGFYYLMPDVDGANPIFIFSNPSAIFSDDVGQVARGTFSYTKVNYSELTREQLEDILKSLSTTNTLLGSLDVGSINNNLNNMNNNLDDIKQQLQNDNVSQSGSDLPDRK